MKSINGLIFIIVGIIVAGFSYFMKQNNLTVFIYIGIGMIAYGIVKLIIQRALYGGSKKDNKRMEKMMSQPVQSQPARTYSHVNPNMQYRQQAQHTKFCDSCGTMHHANAKYCTKCGKKFQA